MSKKSKPAPDKKLEATVKQLKADVELANAEAARWKKQAKRSEGASVASKARVAKLEKKLVKARRKAQATEGAAPEPVVDATWTVTALRAEARTRGLAGYSRRSKADLLAALS